MFNDDDSWGPNWLGNGWERDYDYNREGASHYQRLYLEGDERGVEYTSSSQQAEARFYFLYLCRDANDQACNDGACEKDLHVRADYEGYVRSSVNSGGIWSHGVFGSAEGEGRADWSELPGAIGIMGDAVCPAGKGSQLAVRTGKQERCG